MKSLDRIQQENDDAARHTPMILDDVPADINPSVFVAVLLETLPTDAPALLPRWKKLARFIVTPGNEEAIVANLRRNHGPNVGFTCDRSGYPVCAKAFVAYVFVSDTNPAIYNHGRRTDEVAYQAQRMQDRKLRALSFETVLDRSLLSKDEKALASLERMFKGSPNA